MNMNTKNFDEILEEAMSFGSYMDVRELRALYYGRLNVFVSFSDDGEYQTKGYDKGTLERPSGILAHSISDVVGRKVGTHLYYANVFRKKVSSGYVEDIRSYDSSDLQSDVEALRALPYLKPEVVEDAVEASGSHRILSAFESFWVMTKTAAGRGSSSGELWARILTDLGYKGFTDSSGRGILVKEKVPCTIILNTNDVTDLDIVPVQKYRSDNRRRIADRIERRVNKLSTTRNRVAKAKVTRYEKPNTSKTAASIARRIIGGGIL